MNAYERTKTPNGPEKPRTLPIVLRPVEVVAEAVASTDDLRHRQERLQDVADGDRPTARAAAAVRLRERLVEVDVDDVEAHVAGPRDAADGIEVRPVVVHEGAGAVEDPLHLLDPLVEETERRRVREHEAGRRLVDLPAEVVEVDVAAGVRRHLHELVARHRHARRVRAVSGVRHDDSPPRVVLATVGEVRVHEHEARQLALRARPRAGATPRPGRRPPRESLAAAT